MAVTIRSRVLRGCSGWSVMRLTTNQITRRRPREEPRYGVGINTGDHPPVQIALFTPSI